MMSEDAVQQVSSDLPPIEDLSLSEHLEQPKGEPLIEELDEYYNSIEE